MQNNLSLFYNVTCQQKVFLKSSISSTTFWFWFSTTVPYFITAYNNRLFLLLCNKFNKELLPTYIKTTKLVSYLQAFALKCMHFSSPLQAANTTHMVLEMTALIAFGGEYKLWNSSLYNTISFFKVTKNDTIFPFFIREWLFLCTMKLLEWLPQFLKWK